MQRISQASHSAGQVVMDWLSIPRQLFALAWALVGLGLAYLAVRLMTDILKPRS